MAIPTSSNAYIAAERRNDADALAKIVRLMPS
jgi:hypothetical protein